MFKSAGEVNESQQGKLMNEPWFSSEIFKFMPTIINGLPIVILGVMSAVLAGNDNFKQYFTVMAVIALLFCVGSFVFGIVAKFYDQPDTVYFGFLLGGGIGSVIIAGLLYEG